MSDCRDNLTFFLSFIFSYSSGNLPADLLFRCLYAALQNTDRLDSVHPGRGSGLAVDQGIFTHRPRRHHDQPVPGLVDSLLGADDRSRRTSNVTVPGATRGAYQRNRGPAPISLGG